MTNNSVTDFSILINAYDNLKAQVSDVRAILCLLRENNLCSIVNLHFCLEHMDQRLSELEWRMEVFFENVTYFNCSPGK